METEVAKSCDKQDNCSAQMRGGRGNSRARNKFDTNLDAGRYWVARASWRRPGVTYSFPPGQKGEKSDERKASSKSLECSLCL